MAYKKPEVIAKSDAKQSFVAGCNTSSGCSHCFATQCEKGPKR